MITLLKNVDCYCPEHIGIRDILLAGEKIYKMQPDIPCTDRILIENVIDCGEMKAFPGFIDQHVHILGGGGEEGFPSHVEEIHIDSMVKAGVTTAVGLLGADGITRSLASLYAKAKALELQGITTFMYSGWYSVPFRTLTQDIVSDLVLIDKVIGVGEIALADHRSSNPTREELLKMASQVHLGGMLGGKAGILHLHLGDGKAGLSLLIDLINNSDLPMEEFVPTHTNRNPRLFEQAIEYCLSGGNIDLTAGETAGITISDAFGRLLDKKVDWHLVTVSSDANGSIPGGGVGSIQCIYDDIIGCIREEGIDPSTALRPVTENAAKRLKLYPRKGTLQEGSDADILLLDEDYNLKKVFARGKLILEQ